MTLYLKTFDPNAIRLCRYCGGFLADDASLARHARGEHARLVAPIHRGWPRKADSIHRIIAHRNNVDLKGTGLA